MVLGMAMVVPGLLAPSSVLLWANLARRGNGVFAWKWKVRAYGVYIPR